MPDLRISIALALFQLACTSHQPAAEQVEDEPAAAVAPAPPPVVQAPPAVDKAPEPPPPLESKPIVTVPATTPWREIPGMESVVGFHPFVFGVLVICGPEGLDDICKLRDDDTLEQTPVSFPEQDMHVEYDVDYPVMTGNWRSDAWIVGKEATNMREEYDEDERGDVAYDTKLVLRKLRTDDWFPSPIDGAKRVDDRGQQIRKGWAGGMLVWNGLKFTRVPAATEPPAPSKGDIQIGGLLFDFFEAESGRLYTVVVVVGTELFFVQRPCDSPECVIANAVPLPTGTWEFEVDIPRAEHGISVVVRRRVEDEKTDHLLHFDPAVAGGRWALDRWPTSDRVPVPNMLWPDTREGMWAKAGDALWYRDSRGEWFDVALPFAVEPGDAIHFANRMKPREFLVLLVRDGVGRVFATKGPPSPA